MTRDAEVEVRRRHRDDQPDDGWTRTTGTVTLPGGETIAIVEQLTEPIDVAVSCDEDDE